MKKRFLKIFGVSVLAVIALYALELAVPKRAYFIERAGIPATVEQSASNEAGIVSEQISVRSNTGLAVTMRVRRPEITAGSRVPLLVVIGGQATGKDAVDLVGEPDRIAYLAIDYPYSGQRSLHGFSESLRAVPGIQKAFLDTPPALSLAVSWALQQEWVDPARVELVGVSLGVPFAAVAGAVDARFSRVWLLHGGVENLSWVEHAAEQSIENGALRSLAARAVLFLAYGNSFNTRHWIGATAPRPVVFIAACDDDFVPRDSVTALVDGASSQHVEIIWTEGLHIGTRRVRELQQLLDIVISRVIHAPAPVAVQCEDRRSA
jgi:fermentation-respiration switch protein FrsA (DUF1100 family)